MKYKFVNITCYCGREHIKALVGQPVKCGCGITLHTQQKKHGTGDVWGSLPGNKKNPKYIAAMKMVQNGESALYAEFVV